MRLNEFAKAIGGGAVAFLAAFDGATALGSVGGEAVTANEWVRIVVSTLAAGVAVYLIPNEAPAKRTTVTVEATQTAPEDYVGEHLPR